MKKVYLSVDVEGINKVVNEQQTIPSGGIDYKNTLTQLHIELNAIISALKEAKVKHITVNDAHNTMDNISRTLIPEDVQLLGGKPREISMMYGLDNTYDCIFYVGYHSKAGNKNGILAHTFNLKFKTVKLNGKLTSEAQLNSIYAGQTSVPIAFASGDNFFCQEIKKDIGNITTVTTKTAQTSNCGIFRENSELIADLKNQTINAIKNTNQHVLYNVTAPYVLEVDLGEQKNKSKFYYLPSAFPNVEIQNSTIIFKSNDFKEIYTFLQFISSNI